MYKSHPSNKFDCIIQKGDFIMTTFTLDRNFGSNDFLFAAMNDSVYADLKASREMEGQRVSWETAEPQLSLGARFRKFFMGR